MFASVNTILPHVVCAHHIPPVNPCNLLQFIVGINVTSNVFAFVTTSVIYLALNRYGFHSWIFILEFVQRSTF